MARVYGVAPSPEHANPLPAPQPNAMAAVLRGVMGSGDAPWFFYGIGAVFGTAVDARGPKIGGLAIPWP